MDLTPKQYLLIYALVVTSIVVSFFFVRRNQNPTRLNLDARPEKAPERTPQNPPVAEIDTRAEEKPLNILFQWNGHCWDAYEVLGIPAGSSPDAVQKAYQELITRSGSDAVPFFKAAYESIVQNRQKSSRS